MVFRYRLSKIRMFHGTFTGMFRPRGLMDKASDFESEDCEFESRRGQYFYVSEKQVKSVSLCVIMVFRRYFTTVQM